MSARRSIILAALAFAAIAFAGCQCGRLLVNLDRAQRIAAAERACLDLAAELGIARAQCPRPVARVGR